MADSDPKSAPYGEMPPKLYAMYHDERKQYTQTEQEYARSYDRVIITLAGGAIALSLAFLKDIVGDTAVISPWLLIGAWTFLILAVALIVISVYLTPLAFNAFRAVLDTEAQKGGGDYWTRVRREHNKIRMRDVIRLLNLLSLISFIAGLIMLVSFTYGSVSTKGVGMPENTGNDPTATQPSAGRSIAGSRGPAVAPVDRVVQVPEQLGLAPPPAPVDQVGPAPEPQSSPPPSNEGSGDK